ncbi:leukocyte elastase inhibitor-like isoform X2 [Pomacea canaliculata]|uniref:leukocyte elastase inhibitor-like isoform X2 n=1 Tax=Pomacea canaliculata TaxID=400727 RepID=UPI000D7294DB|nr:leukocyte elastase inhibitor-like isoform X2 [Pomacea canaliculata]
MSRSFIIVIVLTLVTNAFPGATETSDNFAQEMLLRAHHRLTTGLYRGLSSKKGNLVISPWSVMTLLSVTLLAADGRTANEIGEHMYIPLLRRKEILEGFENINMFSGNSSCESSFESVNMALVGGGGSLVLSDRLVKMLQLSLNTHVNPINASHNDSDNRSLVDSPPSTVSTSADEMTNERVRELLAHNLNSDNHQAELWLFSFVAFQGTWSHTFNPRLTYPAAFKVDGQEEVRVPTMVSREVYPRGEYPELAMSLLELPYGVARRYALFLLLPHQDGGLPVLEQRLKHFVLERVLSADHVPTLSKVYLPKFRLKNDVDIQGVLKSLGFKRMFLSGEASFSRLVGKDHTAHVRDMTHLALIEVNENGTVAAAATALRIPTRQYVEYFRVNHPFMFVLRDKLLGINLFVGRVTDPRQLT